MEMWVETFNSLPRIDKIENQFLRLSGQLKAMVSSSSPVLLPLRYLKSLSGIPPDRFATVEAQY